jgi:antitoxin MazE
MDSLKMKTRLTKIGNSKGVRIPKSFIQQCELEDIVELTVRGNLVVISPAKKVREGWAEAFSKASREEEVLLDVVNEWDEKEWTW